MAELWLRDNQKHTRPTDNRPDKHGWQIAAGYRSAPNLSTTARTEISDRRTTGHSYSTRKEEATTLERSKRKRNEEADDDNNYTERRKQKERKK